MYVCMYYSVCCVMFVLVYRNVCVVSNQSKFCASNNNKIMFVLKCLLSSFSLLNFLIRV